MFKNYKKEEQKRIQKTRIECLERSLSNIVKYIRQDIKDPIKEEEFLSGVRLWPWNDMPVIGGGVTNMFIDLTKDMDDADNITLTFEKKYSNTLLNYYFNNAEFPKKSLNSVRYIITAIEFSQDESSQDNNDKLKVTFTKIYEDNKTIVVRAKDGSYQRIIKE